VAAVEEEELLREECSNVSGNFFGSSTPSMTPGASKPATTPEVDQAAEPPAVAEGEKVEVEEEEEEEENAAAATADLTTPKLRRSTRDKIPSQKAVENARQLAEQQAAKLAKLDKKKKAHQ
jgi:hypothetical protein